MTAILDIIRDFRTAQGEVFRIEGTQDGPYAAVDPRRMRIEAAAGASGRIVVVHTAPDMSSLEVVAAEDARLEITEVFLAEAFAEVAVKQSARSLCRLTAVQLTSANVSYTIDLDGRDAENMLGGVFLAGGEEHCVVKLRTNHNVPDCRSNSYIKGVAGHPAPAGDICRRREVLARRDGGADGLGSRAVYAPARPERGAGPPAADRRVRGRRRTPLRCGAVV